MPLEYTVKKEYTIPYLNAYFFAFSIVSIAGLAVLNVVLQGYEVVSVLRSDPNATDTYWWSTGAFSVRSAGECNPVSLPQRSTLSTNSSLFTYELHSTFDKSGQNIAGASSYTANPLHSCTVDNIVANIDNIRQSFEFDIPILCTGSDLPFSLSLISKFSLSTNAYHDDIISHYTQNKPSREHSDARDVQRNTSSPLNIIAILDAISSDLQYALMAINETSTTGTPSLITTTGSMICPGGQNTTCRSEDMRMTISDCTTNYYNGNDGPVNEDKICKFLDPVENSFINMFTVLQDAYHIDLGNIQPSNTLLNMQAFSSRIRPSTFFSEYVQNHEWETCTWGLGCVSGSPWVDLLLESYPDIGVGLPTTLSAGNASAVIKVDYLCPEFKIKTPGSLITSVFIGTWSMYMALVGLFEVVGPILERRYGRKAASDNSLPELAYEAKP